MRTVVFAAAGLSLILGGCASLTTGQTQSISVETRTDAGPVSGAQCRLSNNKGTWFVTTPGSASVQRSFEAMAVRCEKEQHEPGIASVQSSTKAMAFGNILFGGIIGGAVDISTGAAYDYPNLITVLLSRALGTGTPAPVAPVSSATPATAGPSPAGLTAPAAAAPGAAVQGAGSR